MGEHQYTKIPLRRNHLLQGLIFWLLALWIITAIKPYYPEDWLIENLLVFVFAVLLTATYNRFTFTNLSYVLFGLFISLHLIGAHYTYSEVPLGYWMQEAFNLTRNHYDRIVHFCYGLLNAYPLRELFIRSAGVKLKWSYVMAIIGILSLSCFFELLEAAAVFLVSPDLGDAYLGTQGDIWDAEKDMFLALSGAIVAMTILWFNHKKV